MDLRAIDTMVPRPILKHEKYHANAIIMENIRDTIIDVVQKAFSNEPDCDGDPFGVKRLGIDPTTFCRASETYMSYGSDFPDALADIKVSDDDECFYLTHYSVNILLLEKLSLLLEKLSQMGAPQPTFIDELQEKLERAVKVAAEQWSARCFVKGREKRRFSLNGAAFPLFHFDFTFAHSTYFDNPEIPDEKIFWDAYCRKAMVDRRVSKEVLPKHELCAADFGREFPLKPGNARSPVVRILSINHEKPNSSVVLEYVKGKNAGKKVDVRAKDIELALYEDDFEDKTVLTVLKAKDEEALFYKNKISLTKRMVHSWQTSMSSWTEMIEAWKELDVTYREIFDTLGTSFVLTEIFPNARTNIFGAVCCDADSPEYGHRVLFGWDLIERMAECRDPD